MYVRGGGHLLPAPDCCLEKHAPARTRARRLDERLLWQSRAARRRQSQMVRQGPEDIFSSSILRPDFSFWRPARPRGTLWFLFPRRERLSLHREQSVSGHAPGPASPPPPPSVLPRLWAIAIPRRRFPASVVS